MKPTITNYTSLDQFVFEKRNITYGAYVLRQKYEKHLLAGLTITFAVFALGMTMPKFFKNGKVEEGTVTHIPIIDLFPPPVLPVVPENFRIQPPPPPQVNTNFIPTLTSENVEDPTNVFENNRPLPVTTFNPGDGIEFTAPIDFGDVSPVESGEEDKNKPFVAVEEMPRFNGDLAKFLEENFRYPQKALEYQTEGKVFLSFVVGADGLIRDIKVLKGISKECDEEAIRVVKKMPAWIAGKQSGKAVPVQLSLPIVFQLN